MTRVNETHILLDKKTLRSIRSSGRFQVDYYIIDSTYFNAFSAAYKRFFTSFNSPVKNS